MMRTTVSFIVSLQTNITCCNARPIYLTILTLVIISDLEDSKTLIDKTTDRNTLYFLLRAMSTFSFLIPNVQLRLSAVFIQIYDDDDDIMWYVRETESLTQFKC